MMSSPEVHAKQEIETPAIKAFLKTSFLDWRGKICPVCFFGYCNFRCPYCHNRELVLTPEQLPVVPLSEIFGHIFLYGDWLDGIVISGGEPTLYPGLPYLCKEFHKMGLKIKLDTNGSRPEILAQLLADGLVDYVAMDFKAPLNEFNYRRCTGIWTDVNLIGQSLDLLLKSNIDYEFRVTICPGLLDIDDIVEMAKRIEGTKRFVLQNFVPQNTLDPSIEKTVPYPKAKLEEMKKAISSLIGECLVISPL